MRSFKVLGLATAMLCASSVTAIAGVADWGLVTDPAVLARSASLPAYAATERAAQPQDPKVLGPVWATVCTFQDDATAGQAAALSQLRARAALKGANGIADLSYRIVATRGACFHRGYTATGLAMVFN